MRTPHTVVWNGKKVKVKLRDGSWFVDTFMGSKGKRRFFKTYGEVMTSDIKSLVIWKGLDHQHAKN